MLICGLLAGCSGEKLYSSEELHEIHDVVGVVEEEQREYYNVIAGSLPNRLREKMTTDYDFIDYLATRKLDPNKPTIALTFDDGPRVSPTNRILDVLEQYNARATFFVVGDNLGENTQETMKRMVSLGCEIGNHTLDHTYLTEVDSETMLEKIDGNNEKIKEIAGVTCRLVRPPGGYVNDTLQELASQPLIMWTVDTRDWETRDASKVIPIVESEVCDGAIILMHDIYDSTAQAVETIVPELVNKGYQIVTVSELAYLKGIQLEPGQKYYSIEAENADEE